MCAASGVVRGCNVLERRSARQDNQRQSFQVLNDTDRELCLIRFGDRSELATVALPAEGAPRVEDF